MEGASHASGRRGAQRAGSRDLRQLRRLAGYLRPTAGGSRRARGPRPGRCGRAGRWASACAMSSMAGSPRPPRSARPRARGLADRDPGAGRRDLRPRLSGAWLGERVVADLREAVYGHVTTPVARLLRDHPHRRGAVAPDHRHQRDPGGDQRQPVTQALRNLLLLFGGLALLFVTNAKLTALVLHRRAAGGGADRRDRPPRAAPVAPRPGPGRRRSAATPRRR